jgi:hypothetical protein
VARCTARYPGTLTLKGRPIRCELARGHSGRHGHSFAARYWEDGPEPCPQGDGWQGCQFLNASGGPVARCYRCGRSAEDRR